MKNLKIKFSLYNQIDDKFCQYHIYYNYILYSNLVYIINLRDESKLAKIL